MDEDFDWAADNPELAIRFACKDANTQIQDFSREIQRLVQVASVIQDASIKQITPAFAENVQQNAASQIEFHKTKNQYLETHLSQLELAKRSLLVEIETLSHQLDRTRSAIFSGLKDNVEKRSIAVHSLHQKKKRAHRILNATFTIQIILVMIFMTLFLSAFFVR